MRIALGIEGGLASFPGLRRPTTIDTDALPEPERTQVCALVDAARFFTAVHASDDAAMPDARTYMLEIEDGARRRRLRLCEPVRDPAMAELVARVRDLVARSRNAAPPAT